MCVATIIYKHKCIFAQVLGGYVSRIDKIVGLLAELSLFYRAILQKRPMN